MIALVQRVSRASVSIDGKMNGSIGKGMLILLGVHHSDTQDEAAWMAAKCARLRIFQDDQEKMNRSLLDCGGEALVVSQFTLYGDVNRGNRPSFIQSAAPDMAETLYHYFVDRLSALLDRPIPTGVFGAMMQVELVNDGPVTLHIERRSAVQGTPPTTDR